MKLARVLIDGEARIAVVANDQVLPLDKRTSALAEDDVARLPSVPSVLPLLRSTASEAGGAISLTDAALLAPVARPGKIVAIGRNYRDHAIEEGAPLPAEPLVFAKFPSSIVGSGAPIRWDPGLTSAVDYEAELAVLIGARATRVAPEDALGYVFGYTCLNDVSARDLQFGDGQWVRGKSLDTFCPIGPWIVTADEVPDPQDLEISCTISGERLQHASTSSMLFSVAELISRLSRSFTLEPGDVIATGTPEGVGYFREPRRLLQAGDTVEVKISSIGVLRNPVSPE
jgi:2-keto-4-pentenoate hydratase/2-oxohepta-3-ene-1,7-dioic acid hydratase in catechol pathway